MLAVAYHGPKDLRVEVRPIPATGPSELFLRMEERP